MKKQYTKEQLTEAIAHWTKVLEGMDMNIEIESIVNNAKANVEMISSMIRNIEKRGNEMQYSDAVNAISEFNDWCQEQIDKSVF